LDPLTKIAEDIVFQIEHNGNLIDESGITKMKKVVSGPHFYNRAVNVESLLIQYEDTNSTWGNLEGSFIESMFTGLGVHKPKTDTRLLISE